MREHSVTYCAYDKADWLSEEQRGLYRASLERIGIPVWDRNPIAAIRAEPVEVILFEFYSSARAYIDEVRFWQPRARVLIDSVDVQFNRLLAKARLTQLKKDNIIAQEVKHRASHVPESRHCHYCERR